MYGMPREASLAHKLAFVLQHLTFDREATNAKLLDDVCAALLDEHARRARLGLPTRMIRGSPLVEPDLRDAAHVMGYVWDAERMARFTRPETIATYAHRTAGWLRPVLETHGCRWPWRVESERQVA